MSAVTCPHGYPSPASCLDCIEDAGVGAEPTEPLTVEVTFSAKFDGDCSSCGFPVRVGQLIAKMSNGTYVHDACIGSSR